MLSDVEYLGLLQKDAAKAKAAKIPSLPTLEQVQAAIDTAPAGTVVERRNRALVAFPILPGIRDRAMASLSLRHVDLTVNAMERACYARRGDQP